MLDILADCLQSGEDPQFGEDPQTGFNGQML